MPSILSVTSVLSRVRIRMPTLAALVGVGLLSACQNDPVYPGSLVPESPVLSTTSSGSVVHYGDRAAFLAAIAGAPRISSYDFTNPRPVAEQHPTYGYQVILEDITFRPAFNHFDLFVYWFPNEMLRAILPPGTIGVGFDPQRFYDSGGEFVIRVSTGEEYRLPNETAFFGVTSDEPIEWVEMMHTETYGIIDNLVVAVDPASLHTGGFVTGGGWITSPAGAYAADPTLTGRATFGFVAKYDKDATVPGGNAEFQFNAGSLSFKSTNYEWLAVAGDRARVKGQGPMNGGGSYGFLLTAIDGQVSAAGGPDKLRIKIWDKTTGAVVYDNHMGASEHSRDATELGDGSIVIHNDVTRPVPASAESPSFLSANITDLRAARAGLGDARVRVVPTLARLPGSAELAERLEALDEAIRTADATALRRAVERAERTLSRLSAIGDAAAAPDLDAIRLAIDDSRRLLTATRQPVTVRARRRTEQ